MKILKGIEIPICICISYTIISVAVAILNLALGYEQTHNLNAIAMFLWTSIAVLVLSIHHWFDEWLPLAMIVVQYVIAMGLVLLVTFVLARIDGISEGGYIDAVRSFTIPYIIGALVYYISLFRAAGRQDKIIQEINQMMERRE